MRRKLAHKKSHQLKIEKIIFKKWKPDYDIWYGMCGDEGRQTDWGNRGGSWEPLVTQFLMERTQGPE